MPKTVGYSSFSMIPLGEVPEGIPINPQKPPVKNIYLIGAQLRDGIWYTVGTVSAMWRDNLVIQQHEGHLFVQIKPMFGENVALLLT